MRKKQLESLNDHKNNLGLKVSENQCSGLSLNIDNIVHKWYSQFNAYVKVEKNGVECKYTNFPSGKLYQIKLVTIKEQLERFYLLILNKKEIVFKYPCSAFVSLNKKFANDGKMSLIFKFNSFGVSSKEETHVIFITKTTMDMIEFFSEKLEGLRSGKIAKQEAEELAERERIINLKTLYNSNSKSNCDDKERELNALIDKKKERGILKENCSKSKAFEYSEVERKEKEKLKEKEEIKNKSNVNINKKEDNSSVKKLDNSKSINQTNDKDKGIKKINPNLKTVQSKINLDNLKNAPILTNNYLNKRKSAFLYYSNKYPIFMPKIFEYLDIKSASNLSMTCKSLYELHTNLVCHIEFRKDTPSNFFDKVLTKYNMLRSLKLGSCKNLKNENIKNSNFTLKNLTTLDIFLINNNLNKESLFKIFNKLNKKLFSSLKIDFYHKLTIDILEYFLHSTFTLNTLSISSFNTSVYIDPNLGNHTMINFIQMRKNYFDFLKLQENDVLTRTFQRNLLKLICKMLFICKIEILTLHMLNLTIFNKNSENEKIDPEYGIDYQINEFLNSLDKDKEINGKDSKKIEKLNKNSEVFDSKLYNSYIQIKKMENSEKLKTIIDYYPLISLKKVFIFNFEFLKELIIDVIIIDNIRSLYILSSACNLEKLVIKEIVTKENSKDTKDSKTGGFSFCNFNEIYTNDENLSDFDFIDVFSFILNRCKNSLKTLEFGTFTNDSILNLISLYPNKIENLSIKSITISDEQMYNLLNRCGRIKKLELRNSISLSGEFLIKFVDQKDNVDFSLKEISISVSTQYYFKILKSFKLKNLETKITNYLNT